MAYARARAGSQRSAALAIVVLMAGGSVPWHVAHADEASAASDNDGDKDSKSDPKPATPSKKAVKPSPHGDPTKLKSAGTESSTDEPVAPEPKSIVP